jgi:hypothetical protein
MHPWFMPLFPVLTHPIDEAHEVRVLNLTVNH